MKQKNLWLLILCLLSGCTGFSSKENIVGNYYLIATDTDEQSSLSYCEPADKNGCIGIIEATVFAVGYNKDYIIAKQHPRVDPKVPNKSVTNYFILPITKKETHWGSNSGLIGPLRLDQFNEKKKELNLPPDLKFTVEKSNLK